MEKFFTEKSNFIFDQLTYHRYYTLLRRLFFPYRDQSSLIFTNNILIIVRKVQEIASGKEIKGAIENIHKTIQNLRSKNYFYYNNRKFALKLLMSDTVKIHKIIIQKPDNVMPLHSNLYFTNDAHSIIHIFPEKDYYFIINHLLTPTEFHHYLDFRAGLCKHGLNHLHEISEADLLEQYLHQKKEKASNNQRAIYEKNFDIKLNQWEVMLNSLHRSTIGLSQKFEKQYHFILSHIARLRLNELVMLRDKFMFHYDSVKNKTSSHQNEIDTSLSFGFVFIEHYKKSAQEVAKEFDIRLNSYRYQHKLVHCIGIIFIPIQTSTYETRCDIAWYVHIGEHLVDE